MAYASAITRPVHLFPGDETVTSTQYRQTILNGYVSSAITLYGAAEAYNMPVDTETFERWKRLGAAAGLLDTFLDSNIALTEQHNLYEHGICTVINGQDVSPPAQDSHNNIGMAVYLLRNSTQNLADTKRRLLLFTALRIGDVALKKASCDDISEYGRLLRQEAALSTILIKETVSEKVQDHSNFKQFAAWCQHAIMLGVLADSARDLWADAYKGRVAVPPTLKNAFALLCQAEPDIHFLLQADNRQATKQALQARARFSILPTTLLVNIAKWGTAFNRRYP